MLRILIAVIPRTQIPSSSTPQMKTRAKNAEYLNKDQWLRIQPGRILPKRNEVDAQKWSRERMKSLPIFGNENTEKR